MSYGRIQAGARLARSTVAIALPVLIRLGLIQRMRHRVLAVGQNGGRVWKQLTNTYRLLTGAVSREFDGRTDSKTQESTSLVMVRSEPEEEDAQGALKLIAEARTKRAQDVWLRSRGLFQGT